MINEVNKFINENFEAASIPAGWSATNGSTGGTPANAAWTLRAYNYQYNSIYFKSCIRNIK